VRPASLALVAFCVFALLGAGDAAAQGADLTITKTDSADPVSVGQAFTYTLTVENLGDDADGADGVSAHDSLPASLNVLSVPAECSLVGHELNCDLNAMATGAVRVVVVGVRATQSGTLSNTAEVSLTVPFDPDTANNSDTEATTVKANSTPALPPNAGCPIGNSGVVCVANAKGGLDITGTPGKDEIVGSEGPDVISAGGGNDRVDGRGGGDVIGGGRGNDRLRGGSGADSLFGESGDDKLYLYDPGQDRGDCGSGNDLAAPTGGVSDLLLLPETVDVIAPNCETVPLKRGGRFAAVTIKAWGPGKTLVGGPGIDVLTPYFNEAAFQVFLKLIAKLVPATSDGDDVGSLKEENERKERIHQNLMKAQETIAATLQLFSGPSCVFCLARATTTGFVPRPHAARRRAGLRQLGRGGNDILLGGPGNDRQSGGRGSDVQLGGRGNDRMRGGPGADVMAGQRGNDSILASDGRLDFVSCGPGRDRVVADRVDLVERNCEKVRRAGSRSRRAPG
jgi:uncharacterized repeat protein (TIGR01451 family)